MASPDQTNATRILTQASQGDAPAAEELIPIVYDRLRELAAGYLHRERPGHTLQPTALVHEAYLNLVDRTKVDWKGRTHFLGVAAKEMRRVLIHHARHRGAAKRGGGRVRIDLGRIIPSLEDRPVDILDVDEALTGLSENHERQGQVVSLHYFGGLTVEEIAGSLDISPKTVEKDLRLARAWLHRHLKKGFQKTENT